MVVIRYLLLILVVVLYSANSSVYAKKISNKSFTIVIDPGHGGHDPGAIYQKIKEKDIVLSLAVRLGRYINQEMPDVKIIFTRKTDVFIPLHERAEKAIASKADLFLSLHANSCPTPSVSGTETFVLGMHKTEENLDVAKKENSVILIEDDYTTRYEGFDPNSSESYIMFDLVQEEYFDQSVTMAALVQNNFKHQARRNDRGVKQAGFLVLRQTSMPSILIEAGYLSNTTEAQYLNSEKGQNELAESICNAVKSYKASYETKNDFELKNIVSEETKEDRSAEGQHAPPAETPVAEIKTELKKTKPIVEKARPKDVYYSIQLAVTHSKLELKPYNFRGLDPVYMVETGGLYKYYYTKEQNFEQIQKRKEEAKRYYTDAFITAFSDGKLISVEEARSLQQQ